MKINYRKRCQEEGWREITKEDHEILEEEGLDSFGIHFINDEEDEFSNVVSWEELAIELGLVRHQ